MLTSDPTFIDQLKNGDDDAFRILIDEYKNHVLNTCYRFVQHADDAEEVARDVFVEVFRSIDHFRADSQLSTWIYRIAVNKSLDHIRKTKRKKRFAIVKRLFSDDETAWEPSSNEPAPDEEMEQNERRRILQNAVNELPESQQIAMTLSQYQGLSHKEVAETMGTTVSAVESLLHRGKKNLHKKLESYYKNRL
jgi:RNA polymerase sigma-70 factor (ECF subfamily)